MRVDWVSVGQCDVERTPVEPAPRDVGRLRCLRGVQQGAARRHRRRRHHGDLPALAPTPGQGGWALPRRPGRDRGRHHGAVPFAGISDADVRRAGEPDRETLRARAAHAGPIADDTLLYRIAFHVVG